MARELHARNALLVLGDQVDSQKPSGEGQFAGIEDGASGYRSLPVATVALLQLAVGELAAPVMAAVRAPEAVWPAPLVERLETLVLGAVLFDEIAQTEAFLELYLVASHGGFPCRSMR